MGVDKKLVELDVELDEFNKPKGNPTKRLFANLIKAAREAESSSAEQLSIAQTALNKTQHLLAEANERVRVLEQKVRIHQIDEEAKRLDMTQVDRRRLLDATAVAS